MKIINAQEITQTVLDLCLEANFYLSKDIVFGLKQAQARETNKRARRILEAILENARIAEKEKLAICQDTGLPLVFVEIGQDVKVSGDFKKAVMKNIFVYSVISYFLVLTACTSQNKSFIVTFKGTVFEKKWAIKELNSELLVL